MIESIINSQEQWLWCLVEMPILLDSKRSCLSILWFFLWNNDFPSLSDVPACTEEPHLPWATHKGNGARERERRWEFGCVRERERKIRNKGLFSTYSYAHFPHCSTILPRKNLHIWNYGAAYVMNDLRDSYPYIHIHEKVVKLPLSFTWREGSIKIMQSDVTRTKETFLQSRRKTARRGHRIYFCS